jgi:hypothetical protein
MAAPAASSSAQAAAFILPITLLHAAGRAGYAVIQLQYLDRSRVSSVHEANDLFLSLCTSLQELGVAHDPTVLRSLVEGADRATCRSTLRSSIEASVTTPLALAFRLPLLIGEHAVTRRTTSGGTRTAGDNQRTNEIQQLMVELKTANMYELMLPEARKRMKVLCTRTDADTEHSSCMELFALCGNQRVFASTEPSISIGAIPSASASADVPNHQSASSGVDACSSLRPFSLHSTAAAASASSSLGYPCNAKYASIESKKQAAPLPPHQPVGASGDIFRAAASSTAASLKSSSDVTELGDGANVEILAAEARLRIEKALSKNSSSQQSLLQFARDFYARLVEYNRLAPDEHGELQPGLAAPSTPDRCYDAVARLLETSSKSCCAVCFDGKKLLVATNDLHFDDEGPLTASALFNPAFMDFAVRRLVVLSMHMYSVAREALRRKQNGIAAGSAFFYGAPAGGDGSPDISITRWMFLRNVLPLPEHTDDLVSNVLLRAAEYERHASQVGGSLIECFWDHFTATYDLEQSLCTFASKGGVCVEQLHLLIRYLRDMIKVEDFIASLPLNHPLLCGFAKMGSTKPFDITDYEVNDSTAVDEIDRDISFGENTNIFETVTDGGSAGMHAEMRVLQRLREKQSLGVGVQSRYIGISKLCCAHCNLAIRTSNFLPLFAKNESQECSVTRGFHGNGYAWPMGDLLDDDESDFMESFLGPQLWSQYQQLLPSNNVSLKQKAGVILVGSERALAHDIIQYLVSFKLTKLKNLLQINGPFLCGARDLYAPQSVDDFNDDEYETCYFHDESATVYSQQDVDMGVVPVHQTTMFKRIRAQTTASAAEASASVDPVHTYVKLTFDLYAANLSLDTCDMVGHYVISPHLFVPRRPELLWKEWGTMFFTRKQFQNAAFCYDTRLKLVSAPGSGHPPAVQADAYYHSGLVNMRMRMSTRAWMHLHFAVALAADEQTVDTYRAAFETLEQQMDPLEIERCRSAAAPSREDKKKANKKAKKNRIKAQRKSAALAAAHDHTDGAASDSERSEASVTDSHL